MKLRLLCSNKTFSAVIIVLVFKFAFLTLGAYDVMAADVTTSIVYYDLPTYSATGQTRQIIVRMAPDPPSGYNYSGCALAITFPSGVTEIGWSSESNATGFIVFSVTLGEVGSYTINYFYFPGEVIAGDNYTVLNASISQKWVVGYSPDVTPPTGSVVINDGAASTSTVSVNLTLSASDDLSKVRWMRFSNDGASWSSWEPYTVFTPSPVYIMNKTWNLTSGNGIKTVYVQFMDEAGKLSVGYSDTITLSVLGNSSLSCSLSATTLTVGGNIVVTGYLSPALSEESILIQGRASGDAWSTLAIVSTSSDGGYSFVWTPAVIGTWEIKAIWGGDINTLPCESAIQSLTVIAPSSLSISLSSTDITVRGTAAISGYLSPVREGAKILVQCRLNGGAWSTVGTAMTEADGWYSFVWTPTTSGAWEVKASWNEVPALACESVTLQLQVSSGALIVLDVTTVLIIAGAVAAIAVIGGGVYILTHSILRLAQDILKKIIEGLSHRNYVSLLNDLDRLGNLINKAVSSGKLPGEILADPYCTVENLMMIKETIAEGLANNTMETLVGNTELILYVDGVKKVLKAFATFKDWKEVASSKHPEKEIAKRIDHILESIVGIRRERGESSAEFIVALISDNPMVEAFDKGVIDIQRPLARDFWFSWMKPRTKDAEEYEPVRLYLEENGKIVAARSRVHWRHLEIKEPYLDEKRRTEVFFLPYFHTPIVREKAHITNMHMIILYHVFVGCFGAKVVDYQVVDGVIPPYYMEAGLKPIHKPPVPYQGWYP